MRIGARLHDGNLCLKANAESIKAAGDIFRNALKAKKDDSKQA